ncbi:MAG TPA: CPBP family intramembrane glutamic endopeptidase [Paenibacillaceae bacterium]
MSKFNWRRWRFRPVSVDQLSDRFLLANLYATQFLTVIIGIVWIIFQGRSVISLLAVPGTADFVLWGAGFAALVVAADLLLARLLKEDAMDDGGINERLFRRRAVWHIALIAALVAFCEELLFRGAIQYAFGPYWTSVLFAAVHVRYLRHWLPTGLVFLASYGLGWIMEETGTIWTPMVAHFLIDFTMGLIIRFRREVKA